MSEQARRILVVDDVRENVRLLEAVLEGHGYEAVSATDGQAALALAVSARPDLVLLDVLGIREHASETHPLHTA